MHPRPTDPMLFTEDVVAAEQDVAAPPSPARSSRSTRTWYERLRDNTWFPILGKGAAITAVMLGFSALGAVSMATTEPGVHVAAQATPLTPVEWLAPTSQPSGSVAVPATSSQRPPPSHAPAGAAPLKIVPPCGEPGSLCEDQKKPSEGLTSDGKVILNVANAEVLTQLPGVGARRAQAIVELRGRLKRFRRPSDLLRVRGIGVRSLQRMLPHMVLDPPKPDTSKPDASKPDASKPDASKPDASKPDASKPDASKPDAPKTGAPSAGPQAAGELTPLAEPKPP